MNVRYNLNHGHYTNPIGRSMEKGWHFKDNGNPSDQRAFWENERKIVDALKADLLAEYEVTDNPKAWKVFDLAWDRGHSDGLYAVIEEFAELVDLIRE